MGQPRPASAASLEGKAGKRWQRPPLLLLAALFSVVAAQGQKSPPAALSTLTEVEQIRRMTLEEAGRGYPVCIRGVVTYYNWDASDLFIQDSTAGIWVNPDQAKPALHSGEWVEVKGISAVGDLAPEIDHAHFRNLGEAAMPKPRRPSSDELASGRLDSQWIELEGLVHSLEERDSGLVLKVSSGAFECRVFVLKNHSIPTDILDAQVRVRGVFAGLYDPSSVRVIGFQVLTPSWSDVKVLAKPTQALWSPPVRPIRYLLRLTPESAFNHRVRVRGVVTFQEPGRYLCIRDNEGALLVNTTQPTPLKVGDLIDATGYPALGDYTVILRDAIFQRMGTGPAPQPAPVSPEKLQAGSYNADLVRLSAHLLNCTTRPGEQVLELQADGVTFRAVLNTPRSSPVLGSLRPGSLLQLTGVAMIQADEQHEAKGFELLLRLPADVVVLEPPSWWTARRISWLLGILAAIVIWISLWVLVLRRRVEEHTETVRATLESTADGILVVSSAGKTVAYNRKFAEMWRIPDSLLESHDDNLTLKCVLPQLKDPVSFLSRIRQSYADSSAHTDDVIEFKDGRVFERHSEPQRIMGRNVGRVWGFRDITERRRAEEELYRSRQMLQLVLDNIPERVFWKDRNFNFLGCNRAFALDAGLGSPQEIVGRNDFQLPWKETATLYRADDNLVMEQGIPKLNFEEPQNRPDGSALWLRTSKLPLRDREGKVIGVIGTYEDITERKRAEEELHRSRQMLQLVLDNIPQRVFWKDRNSRYWGCNRAFANDTGLENPEEIVGKNDFDLSWRDMADIYRADDMLVMEKGAPKLNFDEPEKRADGSMAWLRTSKLPLRDREGEVIGVIGTYEDITERKQAERALQERTAYLNALIENNPLAIVTVDVQGRVKLCNPAFEQLFLYRQEEIEGADLDELVAPQEFLAEAVSWSKQCRNGIAVRASSRRRRKDGSLVDVEIYGVPMVKEGAIVGHFALYQDISERMRAQQALLESQALLHSIVNNTSDLIWSVDAESLRLLSFNQSFTEFYLQRFGIRVREGVLPEDLLPTVELKKRWRELYQRALREGPYSIEYHMKAVPRTLQLSFNVLKRAGVVFALSVFAKDITEAKRAEEALRESEENFRSFVENVPVGVYRTTPDGRILMANPALLRMLGYDSWQELASRNLEREGIEADYPRSTFRERVERQGEIRGLETAWKRRDGSVLFVRESARAVRADDGKVLYYDGTLEDISEHRRAEDALIEERHLLRTLLDNVPDHIYFKDRESRFSRINKALAKQFGLSDPAGANGKSDFDFYTGEHAQQAFADEQEIIRTGQPVLAKEEKETWPDGRATWVATTKMPLRDAKGNIIGTFGISRDITEQRQLEEQFRQAHKMEAVGRLASGVAHDFNNLLTVVIGYSDLLLKRLPASDRLRPSAEEIKKAGERAAWLTRQLLAFSRMQVLQPQVLDLGSLLRNAEQMLGRLIGEDIEVVMHLPPGLGHVKADPGQIEQVMMNLAVNARDAMPRGGRLRLEGANVDLTTSFARGHGRFAPGHYVMLAISDTGIGMNEETQAHIFEPFFTTKEKGKGTGLGLATVYGIVKQSGGFIDVSSEPGKGSTFKIYLPLVDQPVELIASAELNVEELSLGSETVLLVEDERAVRSLAREVLEARGYRVLESDGAIRAIELAAGHKEHIQLLLTDVVMPQMNGKELAVRLAPLHPETKVLYMSGHVDNVVVHNGALDPGTAFLQKPFTAQALARKLREVLDGAGERRKEVMACGPN